MRMTNQSARERFATGRVARLATVNRGGAPHVVPVTFVVVSVDGAELDGAELDRVELDRAELDRAELDRAELDRAELDRAELDPAADDSSAGRDAIVFAVDHKPKSTTALRRLDNIAAQPRVAFLVDDYDEQWERLWWVRADAAARIVSGTRRERVLAELVAKYEQYADRVPAGPVVEALVTRWSGWQAS
jgi:PPOX class probable F420-dependent enzyme